MHVDTEVVCMVQSKNVSVFKLQSKRSVVYHQPGQTFVSSSSSLFFPSGALLDCAAVTASLLHCQQRW